MTDLDKTQRIAEAADLLARFLGTPYEDAARAYMQAQVEWVRKVNTRTSAP